MTAQIVLERAADVGVSVFLEDGRVAFEGSDDAVNAMLSELRRYRTPIIQYLESASAKTAVQWIVKTSDRGTVKVTCSPPHTQAEIIAAVPDALFARPWQGDIDASNKLARKE